MDVGRARGVHLLVVPGAPFQVPGPRGDGTHLSEAVLADVWVPDDADGDALRRGLVRFRETKVRGCAGADLNGRVDGGSAATLGRSRAG